MKKHKYDAFISYSHKDKLEVKQFLARIKSAIPSFEYWFDTTRIESGDNFEDKIIDAIDQATLVICCVSNNSIKSDYVRNEVRYAIKKKKRVIPLLLKKSKLKKWAEFYWDGKIDCVNSTVDEEVEKLMQELSKWTGKELNIIDNFTSAERANTHNNTNTSQCNETQVSSTEDCKENISTKKRSQPKSTKKVNSSAEPVSSHIIDTIVSGSPLTSISRTNKILLGGKKKNGITIYGNPITGKLEIIGNPIDIQKSILKRRRVNHTLGIRPPIDRIVLGGQTQPIPTITRTIDKSRNVVTSRIIGPISLLAKKK